MPRVTDTPLVVAAPPAVLDPPDSARGTQGRPPRHMPSFSSVRSPSNRPFHSLPRHCSRDRDSAVSAKGTLCVEMPSSLYAVRSAHSARTRRIAYDRDSAETIGEGIVDDNMDSIGDVDHNTEKQTARVRNSAHYLYAFCTPPRCASAVHRAIALRIMALGDWDGRPIANAGWTRTRMPRGTIAARILLNTSIPKYIVVRNPLIRFISTYLRALHYKDVDALGKSRSGSADGVLGKKIYPISSKEEIRNEFEEWVVQHFSSVLRGNPVMWKGLDPHLRPQTTHCGFHSADFWRYFTIFKIEDRKAIADYMQHVVPPEFHSGWGDGNTSLRSLLLMERSALRPKNIEGNLLSFLSFHSRGSDDLVKVFYRKEATFDLVEAAYARDIEMLGYKDDVRDMRKSLFGQ